MVPSTLRSFMTARPPIASGSALTPRWTSVSTPSVWSALISAGLSSDAWMGSTLSGSSSGRGKSSTAMIRATLGLEASAAISRRPVERAAPVTRMQRELRGAAAISGPTARGPPCRPHAPGALPRPGRG
jgi:hypothetical protein